MNKVIRTPGAWLPIVMSAAALSLFAVYIAVFGIQEPRAQADEGAAARVFQLLLAGQVPVVAFFAARWLPKMPKQALIIIAAQGVAALIPFAIVFFLER